MTFDRTAESALAMARPRRVQCGRGALRIAFTACLLLTLAACATGPLPSAPPPVSVQFLLVPHADLADDDPDDPSLSPHGLAQAQALAKALRQAPLSGIEVSEFRRTQQTAAPLAARLRLAAARYFSRGEVGEIARRLQQRYRRGQVLMVTDPDMLAPLAAALCRCQVAPIHDQVWRLYRVRPASDVPGQVAPEPLPQP